MRKIVDAMQGTTRVSAAAAVLAALHGAQENGGWRQPKINMREKEKGWLAGSFETWECFSLPLCWQIFLSSLKRREQCRRKSMERGRVWGERGTGQ